MAQPHCDSVPEHAMPGMPPLLDDDPPLDELPIPEEEAEPLELPVVSGETHVRSTQMRSPVHSVSNAHEPPALAIVVVEEQPVDDLTPKRSIPANNQKRKPFVRCIVCIA
jgi:hypothetical protein